MTTQQGTETTSIFLTHIYMTTHKEQRQHRYSWHTYTWPLTRNRDNIDIPDTYIHDHSQGTETTSIFLTHIYMTTHKEQRQHRYCWPTYTWPLTRNRDYIDIPDTYIHDHSQGTETTSIFLIDIYMTTHKQQRQHWYSWHIYTWPLRRRRDNIEIPDTYIHDHSQGTETTSIFLTDIYMTTHKEQRQHRYSWHTYTWPLTRNRDYIDIPDRHIHEHSQGTEIPPIFLTDIYMTTQQGTETTSIFLTDIYMTTQQGTETTSIFLTDIYMTTHKEQTTSIFLTHIYMTTHKEQRQHRYSWQTYTWPLTRNRQHRYSWHTYTWPLTRNRDYIDIPDTHIHDHSQGTETTSIFLTDIYMTTHKEQRLHRYSWHIYTWPLTRNRDNIDIPDRHIHDHSQGTDTTLIFLTHIYTTTHKEQRQHRYSWQTYTWPLTRSRDNIDIPDTYIHDHSQGTETTSIFLTDIYMTTHKEQRQHRYSWHTYTWPLTRNRDYIDIPDRHIHEHSQGTETPPIFLTDIYMTTQQGTETTSIFLTDIYMTTQQGTETTSIFLTDIYMTTHKEQTTSIFLTHIYMTTHKEQRLHRYSWHTYTWPLTRNRDTSIFLTLTHIHDHSTRNRTETTSIFLTHIYMTTHKEQRQHRYSWHIYTWPLTRNIDNIDIPDTHIHDHSQGTETTSIFLTHVYMTTHKEQRQHRYSWQTYTWPLTRNRDNIDIPDTHIHNHTTRNRDYIDIPDTHIHDHTTRNRDNIDIPDRHIHDHSQGTETTSIFLTHIYITTQQVTETTSIFLTHIYMTTHKEQRQHRYSWQTYTWSLTRNRDNINIPDKYIHDHSQGTETTSIFLTDIYMITHKEQRQHRYSWHTYTWPLTRNRDYIDIPDTYIHDHSQGTETTSIFLTDIYMTTHKEQRQHWYSWHIYTRPLTRNRDNIDIHRYSWQTYIHDHSQGTETTSIFLRYMTTQRQHRYSWHTYTWPLTRTWPLNKEQRQHRYSWQTYTWPHNKEQRQHRYSWQTYTWPLTRNRDNIDIPDTHIHDHSQGTETTSIFLTHIYMTTHKEQRQHRYSWHTYIHDHSQGTETTSIFLTHIYMTTQQGTETTSIFLTHIYMTTHKEQRQHRYSWHTYTWPLTRNRDYIDIPDTHIHDHSQGTETTSIFLTHIYMTTYKEQRQHRYSWHTYTWSLTRNRDNIDIPDTHIHDHSPRNRDNIDIPDTHIHDHSQGTETTSIFLTHIYMTTHKEQRQHRYSWQTYTWPLTRNRDNIDIPDTYIHDHSQGTETTSIFLTHIYMTTQQGTETTSIFLTHIYMTTHKEQRQHRYSWQTYTWPLTRNRDNIDIPDTHIHNHTTRNRDNIDIPDTYIHDHSQGTETTSIFLTDIYMTTHKEQRQHRYSWHIYTWPLTRNRDNIDIPDTHIHDHSQGTETTSILLTDIYMTTHKEQRQHRYSWHIYTWPLTRNRDNIDIPDRHIHDHSQATETTLIFLTHIYMTTQKEQRQHRDSWHIHTWPLTRNRDNIDIPDRHIHDHSQGTETT